jgi:HEAT repeat protein
VSDDVEAQRRLRERAQSYLLSLTESSYAGYRANAIEALSKERRIGEDAARRGLLDENLGVRFISAMVIGLERYQRSAPQVHPLLRDPNSSVRIAAVFALARNSEPIDRTVLADALHSNDLTVRSNAALALGELGDPTAIELLREGLDYTNPRATVPEQRLSDLQLAEAMAKLGDDASLSRIRAHLRGAGSADDEVAALAATMLGNLNARRYVRDLMNIVAAWKQYKRSAEVRLAAMGSLAKMNEAIPVDWPLEYFGPEFRDATPGQFGAVRVQATYVLSEIGGREALPYLAELFEASPEVAVRLQAASGILQCVHPGGGLVQR